MKDLNFIISVLEKVRFETLLTSYSFSDFPKDSAPSDLMSIIYLASSQLSFLIYVLKNLQDDSNTCK